MWMTEREGGMREEGMGALVHERKEGETVRKTTANRGCAVSGVTVAYSLKPEAPPSPDLNGSITIPPPPPPPRPIPLERAEWK